MKAQEEIHQSQAQAATLTSYSFDAKYTIVEIAKILELVQIIRNNCHAYSIGQFYVCKPTLIGHGLHLAMQCDKCGFVTEWNGSDFYPDGSKS